MAWTAPPPSSCFFLWVEKIILLIYYRNLSTTWLVPSRIYNSNRVTYKRYWYIRKVENQNTLLSYQRNSVLLCFHNFCSICLVKSSVVATFVFIQITKWEEKGIVPGNLPIAQGVSDNHIPLNSILLF